MKEPYSRSVIMNTPTVAERLGVSIFQVLSWIKIGFLPEPSVPARGHGSRRVWTEDEFLEASLIPGLKLIMNTDAIRDLMYLRRLRRNDTPT